jgi:transposase
MFARVKKSGRYEYLQIVHNERVDGRVKQRVIATLGRLDQLRENGQLDAMLSSCARFSEHAAVISAVREKSVVPETTVHIGPALVFERIWQQLGIPKVLEKMLHGRKFEFPVERAVFTTVLHRLMVSGSDRAAEQWCRRHAIDGIDELELHHLYRAMGWLGEPLPKKDQNEDKGLSPRCCKDEIEERLFAERRDLFTGLELVFFDTTSIYFEGEGGEELGQYGFSKDHRPDRKQIVVGAVLDNQGQPICCELWPGNVTDAKTLIPVVDRLKKRFAITSICIVADRGMISQGTIEQLQSEDRDVRFILGARLRSVKEIHEVVLSRGGRYREVHPPRQGSKDPSPLKVKEVFVGEHRYIVCHNEEQAAKDRHDREAILAKLEEQLKQGAKSLVGNKGYRKYLRQAKKDALVIDRQKVKSESRFDGKWVLRTDTDLSPEEVAMKYKDLLLVESLFRSMKSILETRPVFHKCDDTIRGHVFCSFLALMLIKELQSRMADRGWQVEWRRLLDDLDELQELTIRVDEKAFIVRTAPQGAAGKAIQAAGVSLGPSIRRP